MKKHIEQNAFFWVLQGICAFHRKPFSPELARQQLAAPHTTGSLLAAAQAFGFKAALRKVKPAKFHKESFPLIAWLKPIVTMPGDADAEKPASEQAVPALVLQADAANVLLVEPSDAAPKTIALADFAARYISSCISTCERTVRTEKKA